MRGLGLMGNRGQFYIARVMHFLISTTLALYAVLKVFRSIKNFLQLQ